MSNPLYIPNPAASATLLFLSSVNAQHKLALKSYQDLYQWSTDNIDLFWSDVWDYTQVIGHKGQHVVDKHALPSENPPWFKEARLNWAENMLSCRSHEKTALIQCTEPTPGNPDPARIRCSYGQLYALVADLVSALLGEGVNPGDRVASYSSNCIENVAACLASSAIGAIWVSAAADFGTDGVLERFDQVQPTLIFAVDAMVYNAKVHPHLPKLTALLDGLTTKPKVVVIESGFMPFAESPRWTLWSNFVEGGKTNKLGRTSEGEIEWARLSFDHPLWILFSSGTTGRPKAIVHRAGGMLLQARKEFIIHAGLTARDVFFYYTTTGWMMWNFLVAGLSVGSALVLYDGSPLKDPAYLWSLVDELKIGIFGTSAKYIDQLSKGYKPKENHDLSSLRHIYSTGSPLAPTGYDFVYEHIHSDVVLASITGGTDICSLFAGMCDALPVYRGELQCRMLGMAVESYSPEGIISPRDEPGELICLKPFPCMPVGFWPLPGYGSDEEVQAGKQRYHAAYFAEFEGIWYHGDHVIITARGTLRVLGRSDGVLNPGGIRFGSAELYDVLDACFGPESTRDPASTVVDYCAIGQTIEDETDERVVLFVQLHPGFKLSAELEGAIRKEIRTRRTPRHVPSRILQVEGIPYTLNNKRVEVPVKKIVNGAPLASFNLATLRNPECLREFVAIGRQLREEVVSKESKV